MKLQILGTAAAEGWPAVFCHCDACEKARELGEIRTRSQAIIDDDLLIDFPSDTYCHVISQNIDLSKIKTLLITHSHSDHFAPIDLMMKGSCYAYGMVQQSLNIYLNEACKTKFDSTVQAEILPEVQENLRFHIIHPFSEFTADTYHIHSLKALHAPKEEALLYLIEKEGKSIFYCTDTGFLPEQTYAYLLGKHIDLIVYDATFGPKSFGNGHLGIPDVAQIHKNLKKLGCVNSSTIGIVTHFSHNCGAKSHADLVNCAEKYGFLTAYDGFTIEI